MLCSCAPHQTCVIMATARTDIRQLWAAADGPRNMPRVRSLPARASLQPDQALDPSVTCRCCLSLSRSTSRSMVSPMAQRSSALKRSLEFLPHRTPSARGGLVMRHLRRHACSPRERQKGPVLGWTLWQRALGRCLSRQGRERQPGAGPVMRTVEHAGTDAARSVWRMTVTNLGRAG